MLANKQNLIYWEKQGLDQLCGVHCINSLLQGPFFNEIELASIARELDDQEKELMAAQGLDSKEYKNYIAQDSNNVADDGNYSIQVLQAALKKMGELFIESVDSQINKGQDLSTEVGFICNSDHHWFAIRQVDGKWYNLNSTNKISPEIISDFYLSAFLMSVKEQGYNIFVVRGVYPASSKENLKDKNYQLNVGGTDQRDMEKAIKESMEMYKKQNKDNDMEDEDDDDQEEKKKKEEEEKNKFKAFSGQGVSMQSENNSTGYDDINQYFSQFENNEDPELTFVLKMSLSSKFEVRPQQGLVLQFRFPDGTKKDFTFSSNQTIRDLYDFVKSSQKENNEYKFKLSQNFPKVEFLALDITLEQAGLAHMTALIVQKI